MTPEEKIIFNNQEVSKFGKSLEKPFIGGMRSILTSLVVLSLLGVASYFLFLSHDPKQEPSPTPTPNWSQLINQGGEELKKEKLLEMGKTDEWKSATDKAIALEAQAKQERTTAEEASNQANLSRERQQKILDDMDLYRQRLLPSPASQPTGTSPSPSTQPQKENLMDNILRDALTEE